MRTKKMIGSIERALIAECVKEVPSFTKIARLFELGADPNAVNEFRECVLGIVFEGYCSLYGANLRSGFFAPQLVSCFIDNGFDVNRHGLNVISELQNGCYDKYMRQAIAIILKARHKAFSYNCRAVGNAVKDVTRNAVRGMIRLGFALIR